jgi:hypothetical protein
MSRAAVFVASVGVLCLTVPAEIRAEPIRVTEGSLDLTDHPGGPFSMVGTRGFSLQGTLLSGEGRIDPLTQCEPCEPGSTISVGGSITGPAFFGSATLDGQTYDDINDDTLHHYVALEWVGTIDVPSWRNAPLTISAPFQMAGFFASTVSPGFQVDIEGSGRATLNLVPEPLGTWALGPLRYDFASTATPEPATLTMLGGPLLAALIRRQRRRDR